MRRAVHRRIAARAPKLEAPAEAESGVATPEALRDGSTAIRLAVLGESTALGIGCDAPEEILAAQLALVFADREQRQVEWRTAAAEGATVDYCTTHLVDRLARSPLDVVVVAAGVNDLVRGHRPRRFARDVEALVNRITATAPGAAVVVSGLPDPTAMPLLPRPLAALLARRARTLDATLADAARRHHATFVPIRDLPLGADHLAADGFHPGPAGCRAWAEELAGGIRLG
ncbi:hypothetical protein ADJ73_07380 [Arsenicicoccus sp. oral taxon 190]|nr:hypothetical protein ADJ73_07380 [Arsenicicoccus sp. oral taxon 190]